jgi:dTDP-4-amino-4,6-dideoxygalactose transaminase
VKLKYLESWNEARRQHAATYNHLFAEASLATTATVNAPVQLPTPPATAHHVYHQYVIRTDRRDELREFLTARQIGTEIYYPIPLHLQPSLAYLGHREGDFPEAERAAKELLALPMFPELTGDEQRMVVESIADFYS